MLNECLIHLFNCTCLNMMCVCSTIYRSNQKDFWSFYILLEVIFITLCVYVLCLLCFSLFKHVLCWKTSVRILGYSFWWLASSETQAASFGYSFWRLASRESKPRVHIEGFHDSLATRQSQNSQKQLFKVFFRGKLVLNLSHPLLNPSLNIFTSKPNQFEWFFIPLTSLR